MGRTDEVAPFAGDELKESEKECVFGPCKCSKGVWLVILVVLLNLFLFADQNLLAPVLTPVAREFGFVERFPNGTVKLEFDEDLNKEVEVVDASKRDLFLGGYITLAFWMLGGIVSIAAGFLTDTVNRRNTLAILVVVGELGCLMTIAVVDFEGLLITRALTGVAIGGAVPLTFSLFGDLFTQEYRGKAAAAATIATGVGGGLGQVGQGILAGEDGSNWRLAFVIVAVPSFFLAALLVLTVKEPKRGHKEEAFANLKDDFVYDEKVTWAKVKELLRVPSVLLVYAQGIPASLPWGVALAFMNDLLVEEKEVERSSAGTVVLAFGVGALLGGLIGGWMSDKLVNRKWLIPTIMGATTAVGALPMIAIVQLPPMGVGAYIGIVIPSGVIIGITGSAIRSVLVNVTKPEVRGTAFAIFNLADDLGKGAAAFAAAVVISSAGDRVTGVTYSLLGWPVGAIFHFIMARYIERDYARTQEQLEELKGTMGGRPIADTL